MPLPLVGSILAGLSGGLSGDSGPTTQAATSGAPVTVNFGNKNLGVGSGGTPSTAALATLNPALVASLALSVLVVLALFLWPSKRKPSRRRRVRRP
ncbi:hypothetical protein [Synoicihabitans lomoniglobus]|uniref:Uncharacterized protein n=1 Tax=Synoicihabitans lomoniglobus TaxID=2909285 RepID=A0AAF0CRR9_9BACT|nr:hypothetical protein [Opitutaceae bacterium LMO-M01]WED66851.1 hypothetical protein PXH66_08310 [Opitutaceae bacterium LMO-M01]